MERVKKQLAKTLRIANPDKLGFIGLFPSDKPRDKSVTHSPCKQLFLFLYRYEFQTYRTETLRSLRLRFCVHKNIISPGNQKVAKTTVTMANNNIAAEV